MEKIKELLKYSFFNNTVEAYLIALGIFLGIFFASRIFKFGIVKRIKRLILKKIDIEKNLTIRIIDRIGWPFYVFLSIYIALLYINLPSLADKISFTIIVVVFVFYGIKVLGELLDYFMDKIDQGKEEREKLAKGVGSVVKKIIIAALWIVAFLLIVSNLGYNITSLLAGAGVAGIAIAFALQGILEDFFAYFSIHFDKPFKPEDFIIIGNDLGTVKKIGIKSTRIQTLQGQELVVSNKELTSVRINNYKRMEKRRILFTFGVTYDTTVEKLKIIPGIVKKIINNIDKASPDRVHFKEYGDFSLNYEVVYFIDTSDYNVYMDIQQEINLKIKEVFEKEKIEFAYPTQSIILNK
ncbi:mechanosensitive ion channel family protein [bacterium]|nr:mechanosensitive ion channel family protein [bacterium]